MSGFDQRGQKVNKQMNLDCSQHNSVANNVNVQHDVENLAIGDVYQNKWNVVFAVELTDILRQVREAVAAGELDADIAKEAEQFLQRAESETQKQQPEKSTFLENLEKGRLVFDKVASTFQSAAIIGGTIGLLIARAKGWI